MTVLLQAAYWAVASFLLVHALAWACLAIVALPSPKKRRQSGGHLEVAVIVPAHDEALVIKRCISSLLTDGSKTRPDVFVVADNCSDETAQLAREAGARVFVRDDQARRGKPFALLHALTQLRTQYSSYDAVVIVDADAVVSPGFADAITGPLARGKLAVQAHYRPEAPANGLERLRTLAFALAHWVRPLGAARLGLGTSLKGNGMAFAWSVVEDELSWEGLAEDAGMTLELANRGVAVWFAPAAEVSGLMASTYEEARTQDLRWESGRASLRLAAIRAFFGAAARGRFAAAAGCLEVAAFPLAWLAALSLMGLGLGVALGSPGQALLPVGALVAACLSGWIAARVPASSALALLELPRFGWHKARIWGSLAIGRGPRSWQRTNRGA